MKSLLLTTLLSCALYSAHGEDAYNKRAAAIVDGIL
jgi:hypothetical protein